MITIKRVLIALSILGVIVMLAVTATPVDAHTIVRQTPSCKYELAWFTGFPDGVSVIDLNSGSAHLSATLYGSDNDGKPVAWNWSALTAKGGIITYDFTWTADGGGHAGPFTFDAGRCYVPPTTTTTSTTSTTLTTSSTSTTSTLPPSTTTTRPSPVPYPPTPVPASPKFTG